ncbi:MAG TPA: hypothetical protein VHE35_27780 [Kofleriaceae bacterium]|nr:hypothetical protein [Kofleriaceae bacterium]
MAGLAAGCAADGDDSSGPPPPSCSATTYRVSRVTLPATWGDSAALALDVDGDGDLDNKLGSLEATLTQVYGNWHPDVALASMLASRSTGWLLKVERCEGSPRLAVSLGVGTDADGDGAFEVADWGEPAVGSGQVARGGVGALPVARLGDGTGSPDGDDGWAPELGLAVSIQPGARDFTATIGMGVEVTDELLAPVAGFLTAALQAGDSRFAAGIDLDHDGTVSVTELRQAAAVRTLLSSDLDLTIPCDTGECYQPNTDGLADRISIGFGITAVPVRVD